MSDAQGDSGPPLLRPIPRRPFDIHLREPTPPEDDEIYDPPLLNLESLNSRLLDPRDNNNTSSNNNNGANSCSDSVSITRASSALNMTGSTLMGIYSPSTYGKDRFSDMTPPTPWSTGPETPVREMELDGDGDVARAHEIQKERAQLPEKTSRRRSSLRPGGAALKPQPMSTARRVFHFGSRGCLLFGLGMLYGMMVAHLRDRRRAQVEDVLKAASGGYGWRYMAFWGLSGVAMGCLLPWFDGLWERVFGREDDEAVEEQSVVAAAEGGAEKDPASCTDWALAIRGIGALVGIAFAIRKLPWDSTLQVSLTLALANPVLWFLLDRSMPGFLFSATVGISGSGVLMGLQPGMVPAPTNPSTGSAAAAASFTGFGWEYGINATTAGGSSDLVRQQQREFALFGGRLTVGQESVATGIWMMSMLFCCCVCFGNIGRWLALNRGAAARGRWAERR
ncbi:insulin-induced protein-domain-containing protein [Hypoxylon sp. FL1150]|nr:insulin-induced protein-domain-containing protein [Hypoxylon sp. FL1150]